MPFSYTVDVPDDEWIPMPAPDEELDGWARRMCQIWEVPEHLLEDYANDLTLNAEEYRRLDAQGGALWVPDLEAGVVATWTLTYGNWDDQPTVGLDEVERAVRERPRARELAEPTVERVELPAGPAVRIREYAADAGDHGPLSESVTHVVVPTGIHDDHGRQMVFTEALVWTDVTHGDELAGIADQCAALLTVSMDA
jgi:hypothetical protein